MFEKQLVDDGILLFKYWLTADQAEQEERLAERLEDPLKRWKLSPMDLAARHKYDEYSAAREAMLEASHTEYAPWTLVDFNDQKRRAADPAARLPRPPAGHAGRAGRDHARSAGAQARRRRFGVLKPLPPFEG